jgi:hypothetical protein
MADDPRLGVALSGGGHRAACWGAGAVLGLVDAGATGGVASVSSVSGGSIANGVLARGGDLRAAGRGDVEAWLAPGLRQWAHDGLFFPGLRTDAWVGTTIGLVVLAVGGLLAALAASVAAARSLDAGGVATATLVVAAVLVVAVVAALKILPAMVIKANAVVGALLALPLTYAAVTAASDTALWLLVVWPVALGLFAVAAKRFGGRSDAAVDGLAGTICPGLLGDLADRPVHHVFCTTNLRTGNNLYLTNRLTWGFPGIFGPAGTNTLAGAVQASACLPGAFLARTTNVLGGDPAGEVVVSDGGVYDNMADQWEWGFPNRLKYAADEVPGGPELLSAAQPSAATHLVVVNASRGMEGTSAKVVKPGLKGEIASALGAKDVLYDVSTATRRRLLVEMFARARRDPGDGPGGMLVHIGTSPWGLVESFGRFGGELGDRARAVGELLARATDLDAGTATAEERKVHWDAVTQADASVATTLAPLERLEPGSTARLLHHAWVLTRVSGHIFFGWGDVDPDHVDDWRRARFDRMVAASRTAGG